jgi:hypothetical protein
VRPIRLEDLSREPVEERRDPRLPPLLVDVIQPLVDEQEIDRPVAHDLVRDVCVTALRVPGLGRCIRPVFRPVGATATAGDTLPPS